MSVDIERTVIYDETVEQIEDVMGKTRMVITAGDDGFISLEETYWPVSGLKPSVTRIGLTPSMIAAIRGDSVPDEVLAIAALHAWNNVPADQPQFFWPSSFPEGSREAWRRVSAAIKTELGRRLTVGRGTLDAEMRGSNPPASANSPLT